MNKCLLNKYPEHVFKCIYILLLPVLALWLTTRIQNLFPSIVWAVLGERTCVIGVRKTLTLALTQSVVRWCQSSKALAKTRAIWPSVILTFISYPVHTYLSESRKLLTLHHSHYQKSLKLLQHCQYIYATYLNCLYSENIIFFLGWVVKKTIEILTLLAAYVDTFLCVLHGRRDQQI